ncbi:hypothetical protein [Planctobacterium marinum]|uniref:Uncharacterized protein n=1 Tax=Planctobacterium marinum TaxID=1631968 RepID=A0AA48HR53_9ALTE|nr:hypothetical protein MACH26_27030 [Planctobacterium marinum]
MVFFLGFAAVSNLLLSIPRALGQESGKTYIEKAVCKDIPWSKLKQDRVVSCTRIETLNQSAQERELHRGVILFKNNQYTIMVTNQKSLLLNNQNRLIAWSEVFERENENQ